VGSTDRVDDTGGNGRINRVFTLHSGERVVRYRVMSNGRVRSGEKCGPISGSSGPASTNLDGDSFVWSGDWIP
jgi:hypothetical protein